MYIVDTAGIRHFVQMVDQMPIHGNSKYSPELASAICERIADGAKLADAAKACGVTRPAIVAWVSRYDEFARMYAAARQAKADAMADDIVPLADSAMGETAANVQAIKGMVDARKWAASKLHPNAYGDKLDVTSAGKALATPVHQVDARVQSIIMMAAERMRLATGVELSDEAKSLLD